MQEQRWRDRSRPAIDSELGARLDRLSRNDAERVLESAIRMQTQRHSSETFTAEQIRRIARELSLDDALVDHAIREELARPGMVEERSWFVLIRLRKSERVTGPADEIQDRVMSWMENEEGLRAVSRVENGICWEKDTHWLTSTRLAFGTDATKSLRGMASVVHRQIPLGSDEHLVEIDVDTRRIKRTTWGVGGGLAALGAGGGALTAGLVPGGNDLLQFLSVAVPSLAVAATTAVVTARAWSHSIHRGVERALSGIAHPELHTRAARRRERRRRSEPRTSRRRGLQRLADQVSDAIEDLFD